MTLFRTDLIDERAQVADIVSRYYRTAEVFRKYNIDYCCGGKLSLAKACEMKGLDVEEIKDELVDSLRDISISANLPYQDWDIDFLTDYIINVHHAYLKRNLPMIREELDRFVMSHHKKMPFLDEVQSLFEKMLKEVPPHLQQEEEIIFPYIKQIAHAYYGQEPYARLLVRTLRKPIEDVMHHEHSRMGKLLNRMRELTNEYHISSDACTSNKVVFLKLKELDDDMVQHIHLENDVLFPRAIAMEKELLQKQD